jgi:hypothetical protein
MANFATLAGTLSPACATRIKPDACSKLFAQPTCRKESAPTDTLTAAQSIARYPWYRPERLFVLLGELYPVPAGKTMRAVPFMPYLSFPPSAWVLPLKFDGGGYRAGGKAMFDSQGNLWVGDNFTVGWQGQDTLWQGNATKFDLMAVPIPHHNRLCWRREEGRSEPPWTPTTTHGWPATEGGPLPCLTRTASR